ncbi:MAG: phosphatase PAP2 family protein [Jatrophihabitantaceae bacterium]
MKSGRSRLVGWAATPHRLDLLVASHLNDALAGRRNQIRFWKTLSAVGGPNIWRALAAVATVGLMRRHQRRTAALVAGTMTGAAMLSGGTKVLVDRHRPVVAVVIDRATSKSFPSGHAMTAFVTAGLVVLLLWPGRPARQRALLLIAAALIVLAISFSRLILGVHFLSDVLGGWLIGGLWLSCVYRLLARAARNRQLAG